jgi:hypothetical protein
MQVPFTWRPTGWFMVGWSADFAADVAKTNDVPPDHIVERVTKQVLTTLWDDLELWRRQVDIETPAFAQQDARPYGALRHWAEQFDEVAA